MKRFIPLIALMLMLFVMPLYAQAADTDEPSHVTITVVMPDAPETSPPPSLPAIPEPEAVPVSVIPKLYPTGVHDVLEDGRRWVIKTYELGAGDDPADIPRETFERDGWDFSLTDITKKETAATDVREHTETITVNTDTKDMEAILRQLAQSMEYISEDGYMGILALNVAGITVETAGTRTSSYTASVQREYPHLSANDTSLVPKTVTDSGRTLTLASVDWKTNYSMTVDYDQIPASYTAVATYTAPASRTVVTGYITTAEYKGELARLNQGSTVYTAYFMGKEIVPERIPLEIIEPTPTPDPEPEPDIVPVEETDSEAAEGESETSPLAIIIPAALFALLIGMGGGYYIPRILKNKKSKGDSDA